jgi:anti-sigma-K factor RskA
MRRGWRRVLLATSAAAIVAIGCGAEDRVSEPRPPAPVELTAKVDDRKVVVSPSEVGAGLANLTISNQTPEDVQLVLEGPTEGTTDPVVGNGVLEYKIDLREGEYRVGTESRTAREATLSVGPERESAQNDLLLP